MAESKKNQCNVPGCDEVLTYLPFKCRYCGKIYCKRHRLPENHDCSFEFDQSNASPAQTQTTKIPPGVETPNFTSDPPTTPDRPTNFEQNPFQRRFPSGRPPPQRITTMRRAINRDQTPFIYPSNTLNATYALIVLNIAFFLIYTILSSLGYPPFLLLVNIVTYQPPFFYFHTLLTAFFVPDNLISVIFSALIIWSMGRNFERRFGPKFVVALYMITGLFTLVGGLILQILVIIGSGPNVLAFYGMSLNNGIFIGLIAFFCFIAGLETQMTFLFFIVPVRLKAKHILIFLFSINIIFGVISLVWGGDFITSFASLMGIFGAYYLYRRLRSRLFTPSFY
jgi:membrane associated rhomboid family serine protease